MNRIKNWVRDNELWVFVMIAYGLSWMVEIPLALQFQGVTPWKLPYGLHYLASYGPLLAALVVSGISAGKPGLKSLIVDFTRWRVRWVWWLAALAPLALYLLSIFVQILAGMPITTVIQLGELEFLPPLGLLALPFWILTFGLGEEAGWRGFALPRLQRDHSALRATFILWLIWVGWHLPLFFYSYSLSILPGFLFGLLAGSIIFTWIYNSTGGSVLLVAIWHGLFNYATACISCKTGFSAAFISTLVMIGAVAIVWIFKPATLSRPNEGTKSFKRT